MTPPQNTPSEKNPTQKAKEKKRTIYGLSTLAFIGIAFFLYWLLYSSHYINTDDAFIENHPVPISFRVTGLVQAVYVDDNQLVKTGDLLAELDPRDYETVVAQNRAKLAQAKAQAIKTHKDLIRYRQLRATQDISQQNLDYSIAADEESRAQVSQAQATLAQSELKLSYTKIYAISDGKVTKKTIAPGAYVQAGQTLFNLVNPKVWVVANFKETKIHRIRPGQSVEITIDAYPGKTFHGRVQSIMAGSGAAFSLFPPENATGNYVKVVQRVPVKIVFTDPWDPDYPIGPGMSVEPKVKIK